MPKRGAEEVRKSLGQDLPRGWRQKDGHAVQAVLRHSLCHRQAGPTPGTR